MIVLKILLWIFLAVLGLIILAMILPVSVKVGYVDKKVILKVKYAFINIFELGGKGIVNRLMGGKKSESRSSEPEKKTASPEAVEEEQITETAASPEKTEIVTSDVESAVDDAQDKSESEKSASEEVGGSSHTNNGSSSASKNVSPEKKKGKTLSEKIDFIHDVWHAAGRPALKIFKGFKFSEFYVDFVIADQDAYKCALNYGRISSALYYVLGWFGVLFNMKYKTVDVNPGFDMKESRWDVSFKLSFNIMNVVIAGLWFLLIYLFKIFIPSKRMKKKMKKAAM